MKISLLSGVVVFCLFQACMQAPSAIEKINDELMEDDMIFTPEQMAFMKASSLAQSNENALKDPTKKWPNNVVRYELTNTIGWEDKNLIRTTLSRLETKINSCLTFVEAKHGTRLRVTGYDDEELGCSSTVGFEKPGIISFGMHMNLAPGCMTPMKIEHEFLHSIGIHHHHNRPDRDQYVKILEENLKPGKFKRNFRKESSQWVETFGIPYDYQSVMHYSAKAFSKNGRDTIEIKGPSKQGMVLGNDEGVTESDILLIKRMYKCEGGPTPTQTQQDLAENALAK